jgi:hypothetical protein
MKDRWEKYLNFSKITMGDYLINIGKSEGMNPRKKWEDVQWTHVTDSGVQDKIMYTW